MKARYIVLAIAGAAVIAGGVIGIASYNAGVFDSPGPMKTEEAAASGITAINIDSLVQNDLKILSHESDTVKVTYYNGDCTISSSNGKMDIKNSDSSGKKTWSDYIHFDFGSDYEYQMTVYIPSSLYADISAGISYGDADISGISGSSLKISSSSGDIDISNGTFGALDVSSSYGDIDIENVNVKDGNSVITNSSGDVDVSNSAFQSLECSLDYGDIELEDTVSNMVVTNQKGNIKFERISGADLSFECSYGDIKGNISGNESDYVISASTDFGDCNLSPKTDGIYKLKAYSDKGDISINFR